MIKYKKYFLVFILIFLFPIGRFSQDKKNQLIIWYVGQGQMVTYSDTTSCLHFDMGGEYLPLKKLVKECRKKENKVFFSHWDWDHINFTKKVKRHLPPLCRINTPGGKGNKTKKQFLSSIPFCDQKSIKKSKKIFKEILFPYYRNADKKHTDSNKSSRIVIVKDIILIPGDSPGSSEKLWWQKIKTPVKILILSHHGSRHSTSSNLLKHLSYLKIAIASARKKVYGHPHKFVKKRLARRGVALLSTEDFNHIRIPLPEKSL